MARRRMIDPNIWQSEDFAHLSILARLIFIGLFSNADDEGKGRAKPVYVKSVIFPYDEDVRVADIEKALSEISSKMSVTLYSHNGNAYYKMNNWKIWQRVDKPQKSKIPEPNDIPELVENHSGIIPESVEPKGKEENEKGKEVEGEEKNAREEGNRKGKDYQRVADMYNETCVSFPRCTKISESRKKAIKARLNSGYTYDDFKNLFEKAENSRFLKGGNDRNWKADFDWLLKDSNIAKVLDGRYDDSGSAPPKPSKFNNFSEQEEYDFDRLEKAAMAKLLEEAGTGT